MPSSKKSKSKGHANDVERKVFYMSPETYIGEGGSGKPEGGTGKKLEGEKTAVIDIAKAEANEDGEFDVEVDFTGSIASFCERLSSTEEECDALASAKTRANPCPKSYQSSH
ncbi:hypothetical protein TL16_g11691 [Triparma laevis f. inornata]|uniref:Uncharacterized protein n=1 Tax=Triparma laevis f. inornata TaxID=1714386 RepID=A0A9W7BFL8_9STRA|nr:hypothetical protein TL16_g11691 [Triparma laevis f. inornata]